MCSDGLKPGVAFDCPAGEVRQRFKEEQKMVLSRERLLTILQNVRFFAGYWVRWKKLDDDHFAVKTNYPIAN